MAEIKNKVLNKRTSGTTFTNAMKTDAEYGELLVAYGANDPKLGIKNSNGTIVEFSSDDAISDAILNESAKKAAKEHAHGTITLSGDATGSAKIGSGETAVNITVTVKDDSHSHNGSYYSKSEVDAKVKGVTDTMAARYGFSKVQVSGETGTTISADSVTDTLYLAEGSGIDVNLNANDDKITIALTDATIESIDKGVTAHGWGDHSKAGYYKEKSATTAQTGVVKLVTGDMNGKANADGQAPSLNHTHSQYADKSHSHGTVKLEGDVTGSASFTNNGVTITTVVGDNTHNHSITANAADDDVVILTSTGGTNGVSYTASHADKNETAFEGGTSTTSVSGYGAKATLKIPKIAVDKKGHVTATDETVTITMPSEQTIPTELKNPTSLTIQKNGSTVATYDGASATTANIVVPTKVSELTNDSKYITSGTTVAAANKVNSAITLTYGSTAGKTGSTVYSGNSKPTVNIPTSTSHITNDSGYITSATTVAMANEAKKVTNSLKFGAKTYNGSSEQTITAEDLGLGQVLKYCGVTTTALEDGSTDTTVSIKVGTGTTAHTASAGCVVFYEDKEFVYNGSVWELIGAESTYKVVQSPVSDPSASSTSITFIDTISQDANGVIKPTKKTVRSATTAATGVAKLVRNDLSGYTSTTANTDGLAAAAYHTHSQYLTAETYKGTVTSVTVTGGTGLTGGGTVSSTGTITISHADTSSANSTSVSTTGAEAIKGINLDAFGHVTGITTGTTPDTKSFTITATATDDDVVILTGTNGTNKVTFDAKHATQGPNATGNTSTTDTTSQSPAHGGKATLNIPKFTVNKYGHVTSLSNQAVSITFPGDNNTHYTSKNVVGATSGATANSAATNGNVWLNHLEESTVKSSHKIIGSGTVSVTADSAGTITITGTDTKVTSVGNHYTPTSSTTKSAAASTATDITNGSGVAVVSGIKMDAAGHVVDVVSTTLKSTNTDTDTNTAHSHSAGVGLTGSGNAGTSGTYTYKAKLRSETAFTVDSTGATTGATSKIYPVAVDKSGYLSVYVPWTDTDTNTWRPVYNGVDSTDTSSAATANAVKTAYEKAVSAYNLANGKTSNVGTVTSVKVTGGTGLSSGGTVTSSGTITLKHAVAYSGTSLSKSTSGANYYLTGVTLTLDGLGHVTALSGGESYDDNTNTNYYLTGVTGSGNGSVTFGVNGYGNVTWNASHTHNYVSTAGGSVVSGTTNFNKIQISGAGATYGTGATLFFGDSETEVYLRNTADKDLTIYANGTLNLNGGSVFINGYTPSRITGASGTVSNTTGTPSVSIATGGTASAQTLSFTFTNIKGAKGDKGDKGDTGNPGTNGSDGDDGFGIYFANTTVQTGTTIIAKSYITTNSRTPQIGDFILSYNGFLYKITSGWTTSTSYAYMSYLTTLKGSDGAKGSNGTNGTNGTNGSDGADGLSMFYCSNNYSSGQTSMSRSYLTPSATVKTPIKGDLVITSGGLLFNVTAVSAATLSVSYLTSLKGADGSNGSPGTNGTNGTNGKSVTQVVCTSSLTSTATTTVNTTDGATNYYRFKDSSGGFITGGITVKNGSSGSTTTTTTTDEKVKSEVGVSTKTYLLGTTAAATATGTAYKSTAVYMSGSSTSNTTLFTPRISATTITASTAFYQSDERLKDFCGEIDVDFEKLKEIPKKYYTWKSDENKELQIGTSAQKVLEVYPELVGGSEDTNYAVDYARLSIVALKAIDKLHDENQMLRELVEKMDKRITDLEEKLK